MQNLDDYFAGRALHNAVTLPGRAKRAPDSDGTQGAASIYSCACLPPLSSESALCSDATCFLRSLTSFRSLRSSCATGSGMCTDRDHQPCVRVAGRCAQGYRPPCCSPECRSRTNSTGGNFAVVRDGQRTKHLGAAADQHIVAQSGVPFTAILAGTAQRHALIKRAVVADLGCLADDNAPCRGL